MELCDCLQGVVPHTQFERTFLGTDDLYAEVSIDHCKECGRNWLHYLLEFESVGRSGRWYRGEVGPETAVTHRNAAAVFAGMKGYFAGGTYYDGRVHWRHGALDVST
jgi:hypothetical protein